MSTGLTKDGAWLHAAQIRCRVTTGAQHGRMRTRALLPAALLACGLTSALAGAAAPMLTVESKPFYLETDVGATPKDQHRTAAFYLQHITETGNFFLQVFQLKNTCFEDYARLLDPTGKEMDRRVRICIFASYEDFLKDFQARYQTKTRPGAYFGITRPKDSAGAIAGPWRREVVAQTEGHSDEQVLRDLYHEMGHLFMRTFMVYNAEVPSWVEEGTAELFQLRKGNGAKPEHDRDQYAGWMVEVVGEGSSIPWKEFTNVRNMDNLDFTFKDPLRSLIQYDQAWSVLEFMVGSPERQNAFTALLRAFRDAGEKAAQAAAAAGLRDQALVAKVQYALYPAQDELFKKCYGSDLLAVEVLWKEWVRKTYDKEVKRNPILRYHRGEWHLAMRARFGPAATREAELDKALALFEECAKESPKLPEAYVGLGRVALERKDLATANQRFDQAVALGPDNFDVLLYGGYAKLRSGEFPKAVEMLAKAVKALPNHYEANLFLANAQLAAGGDAHEALALLTRARALRRQGGEIECGLLEGIAQLRLGQAGLAFMALNDAIPSGLPSVPLLRAVARAGMGEQQDALGILAEAKAGGNAFTETLAGLIRDGKPLPTIAFSASGLPYPVGLGFTLN